MGIFEETFSGDTRIMSTSSLSSFGHVVTTGPTQVYSIAATNINAAVRYLRLYDKATAVDPVTDIAKFKVAVPIAGSFQFTPKNPIGFTSGLTVIATSTGGEATGGSPTAGNVFCFLQYK